jgi:hypothetical protein
LSVVRGTIFGAVHAEMRKQTADINSYQGRGALELANSSAADSATPSVPRFASWEISVVFDFRMH